MDFHAELNPVAFDIKISHHHKIFLIGSCFTEQIGSRLEHHKLHTLQNPNGILFNPLSISKAISSYVHRKEYSEADIFYFNELWNSWDHHSRFSGTDKNTVLANINSHIQNANEFLKNAEWLMITLGSAFVYETVTGKQHTQPFVANCHKVPADKFNRRLLSAVEIQAALSLMLEELHSLNPALKIIFTISPVRHLREGFIENNRSKAALIQAVHHLTNDRNIFYFPAYELIIDDLRDYRFFSEDLVHPNYAATNYVWQKFSAACIDAAAQNLMKEIAVIMAAKNHKPFNPGSEQHKSFLKNNLEKVRSLQMKYEHVNFDAELNYFAS